MTVHTGPEADPASTTRGGPDRRGWTRSRGTVASVLALGLVTGGITALPAQAINSDPPTGPGNIEVFPTRDMVAVTGYTAQAGKRATFSLIRDGAVVGKAVGTVDGTGFLEVNHDGGICWGAGSDIQVTPDVQAEDEIRVDFSDGHYDGAKVSDVEVLEVVRDDSRRTLTLTGRYGAGVDMPGADLLTDPGRFAVEIVNPDMRNASSRVGERAIGWPTDKPTTGYTVAGSTTGTDATGGGFTVTYTFETTADLELAARGEVIALAWQGVPDPATGIEAQYGLTLAEFGEAGGPGMPGCPAGPREVLPQQPADVTARGGGPGSIVVDWSAAATAPGSPPVSGYTVRAVHGEDETGKRLSAEARTTTLTGLAVGEVHAVEVSSRSSAGASEPVVLHVRADEHVTPTATATTERQPNPDGTYEPLVTTDEGDFGVFLDPDPGVLRAEVHYTTDGSTPTKRSRTFVSGRDDSLQIVQDTRLRWLVVDGGGVPGPLGEKFFDLSGTDPETQPAPVIRSAAAAPVSGAVDVRWSRLGDPEVTQYRVQAYTGDSTDVATGVRVGDPVLVAQPSSTTATQVRQRMTGLEDGTEYRFTVSARYGTRWSAESAPSDAVAPVAPPAADAGADQTALRGSTVTLDGSSSVGAVAYRWTQLRPTDATGYRDPFVRITGGDTVAPTFTVPRRTTAAGDDGSLSFRLVTTHARADGTTFTRRDVVDVTAQSDEVVTVQARYRAPEMRLSGTGTQDGARLEFRDGSATGAVIGTAVVTGGTWTGPEAVPALPSGSVFIWSSQGYSGTVATTS